MHIDCSHGEGGGQVRTLRLEEVEALRVSGALVLDACRSLAGEAG